MAERPTRLGTRAMVVLIGALALGSCAGSSATPDQPARANNATPSSYNPVLATEPWTLAGAQGTLITTPSYRIFTTERDPLVSRRVPAFLEMAMAHYTTVLGELPRPTTKLETYILASRSQWALLTRRLMGRQAEVYLKIRAGGYATQGRALLFNIGSHATFSTLAHEGWHQFTQRSFRQGLPIWLEEGIATAMEGYRWDPSNPTRPLFLPWANIERFDRLRDLVGRDELFSLGQLLNDRPQDLLSTTSNERALDYYAQVWALIHFLREGQSGAYRDDLHRLLSDAQAGRLVGEVVRSQGVGARNALARRVGTPVFVTYFSPDLPAASAQYEAFVRHIVRPGGRDHIAAGRSPVR